MSETWCGWCGEEEDGNHAQCIMALRDGYDEGMEPPDLSIAVAV